MEHFFIDGDKMPVEDVLFFLNIGYQHYNNYPQLYNVNYQVMDEVLGGEMTAFSSGGQNLNLLRQVVDLHGYYSDQDEYMQFIDPTSFYDSFKGDTSLSYGLTFELGGELFTSIDILIDDYVKDDEFRENLYDTYSSLEDTIHEIRVFDPNNEYNTEDKVKTLIINLLEDESIMDSIDYYGEILVYNNKIYYTSANLLTTLGLFLGILTSNSEVFAYSHGQMLIYYIENIFKEFSGVNINISKKFNAEIDNFAKRSIALYMVDKMFQNIDYFADGNITYYTLKKYMLPDTYWNLSRKQIERLKRTELFRILDDLGYLKPYQIEGDSYIFDFNEHNAVIPLNYIAHISELQDYNYLWSDDFYNSTINILENYKRKSEYFKNEYEGGIDNRIINYLEEINIYELEKSIVLELDYIPEFMVMGVAPQNSCQSIIYSTGYNSQILGHIHNPLTKILLEFKYPEKGIANIDFNKREFQLNDGEIVPMSEYIISRNVLVLNNGEGLKLQGFYGSPSTDAFNKLEQLVYNKHIELSKQFPDLAEYYEEELGEYDYYKEGEIIEKEVD